MKVVLLTILFGVVVPLAFSSNHPDWMNEAYKVDDPDKLGYGLSLESGCSISGERLTETVENIFTRSRLKPVLQSSSLGNVVTFGAEYPSELFVLTIFVDCIDRGQRSAEKLYSINVDFRSRRDVPFRYGHGYHGYGSEQPELILLRVRDLIEEALTDYILVNFDL